MKLVTNFGKGGGKGGGKGSKQLYCHFLPWGQYVCVRLRGYRPSLCAQQRSQGLEAITVCYTEQLTPELRVFIMFIIILNLNVHDDYKLVLL